MDHPATVNAGNRGTEESECSEPNEVDEELDGIILMADVGVNVLEESPAHDAAPTDINDATLCLATGGAKVNHVLCNHWGCFWQGFKGTLSILRTAYLYCLQQLIREVLRWWNYY